MGGRWNESRALAWKERLVAQQRSGLSIAEFCRREEISPPSFYVWRKRLRRQKASRRNQTARSIRTNSRLFVPVRLASGAEPVGGLRIELPGGTVVTLPAEASTELVTTAIRAVLGTRSDAESSSC